MATLKMLCLGLWIFPIAFANMPLKAKLGQHYLQESRIGFYRRCSIKTGCTNIIPFKYLRNLRCYKFPTMDKQKII